MTVKAAIERATFRFNGTDSLLAIKVTEINNKASPDEESKPLWLGAKHSNLKLRDVIHYGA